MGPKNGFKIWVQKNGAHQEKIRTFQEKIKPFLWEDRKNKTIPLGGQEKIRPFQVKKKGQSSIYLAFWEGAQQ